MAKLSDLVKTIDDTAKAGDRKKALGMLESLLRKVPPDKAEPLEKRRQKLITEIDLDQRISSLESKYGS